MIVSIIFLRALCRYTLRRLFFSPIPPRLDGTPLLFIFIYRVPRYYGFTPSLLPALINISVCFCFLLRFILRSSFLYTHTCTVPISRRGDLVCLCSNSPALSLSDSLVGKFYRRLLSCLPARISPKISALATRQVA